MSYCLRDPQPSDVHCEQYKVHTLSLDAKGLSIDESSSESQLPGPGAKRRIDIDRFC